MKPRPFVELVRALLPIVKDQATAKAVLLMLVNEQVLTLHSDWTVEETTK